MLTRVNRSSRDLTIICKEKFNLLVFNTRTKTTEHGKERHLLWSEIQPAANPTFKGSENIIHQKNGIIFLRLVLL